MTNMFRTKTRYIPKDSQPITQEGVNAVAYIYGRNRECAVGYSGKRNNHDFNYSFRSADACKLHVENWFKRLVEYEADRTRAKEAKKAKLVAVRDSYKPGDIVYTSWGYDMTIVEFYQVIRCEGRRVWIKEICQKAEETGFMCGSTQPEKDRFVKDAKEELHIISAGGYIMDSNEHTCFRYNQGDRLHYNHCD
jgi:hypothetical protein